MGRVAAILVALALGLASAFLVACGDRNSLLPQTDASAINGQLDSVASAVAAHDCGAATDAINAARLQAENLPSKVDPKLRRELQANLEQVASNARAQCTKTTRSTQPTTTTPTQPTQTQTTQTETTQTDTTNTQPPTSNTAPPPNTGSTDTGQSGGVGPGSGGQRSPQN